jgi:hypothetical protein
VGQADGNVDDPSHQRVLIVKMDHRPGATIGSTRCTFCHFLPPALGVSLNLMVHCASVTLVEFPSLQVTTDGLIHVRENGHLKNKGDIGPVDVATIF